VTGAPVFCSSVSARFETWPIYELLQGKDLGRRKKAFAIGKLFLQYE